MVNDPMSQTLAMMEKALTDMPKLLTADSSLFSVQTQPTDAEMMSDARSTELADAFARQMGAPPERKTA